jgi:putative sigma-54 modulation protein
MNYSFVGKPSVVSEALKQKTIDKLSKLSKFLPEEADVTVAYKVTKQENKIEVTIPIQKRTLRAEVSDSDMYAAIDQVVDVLEKQMRRHKTRLQAKSRKDKNYKAEFIATFPEIEGEDETIDIKRTKKFLVKPMDPEEAVLEMELLGHNFYVFKNAQNDEVNIIYKRGENNSYGLIEPYGV